MHQWAWIFINSTLSSNSWCHVSPWWHFASAVFSNKPQKRSETDLFSSRYTSSYSCPNFFAIRAVHQSLYQSSVIPICKMDARWRHSFTCIIAGPNESGKTARTKRLVRSRLAYVDTPIGDVIWCYGNGSPTFCGRSRRRRRLEIRHNLISWSSLENFVTEVCHHMKRLVFIYCRIYLFTRNVTERAASIVITWWCPRTLVSVTR